MCRSCARGTTLARMGFSTDTERKLLAMSGGHCARPDCRKSLFPEEGETIVTVAEMAHVIGRSSRGPRGESSLPESERDSYENAVLLCPDCHDRIDKAKLTNTYTAEVLLGWKHDREQEVEQATGVPRYPTREQAIAGIGELLAHNRAIFIQVGPGGAQFEDPFSPSVTEWRRQLRQLIVPNNWRVIALARSNREHLTIEERQAIAELRVHADALALNALAVRPHEGAPRYPESMVRCFG